LYAHATNGVTGHDTLEDINKINYAQQMSRNRAALQGLLTNGVLKKYIFDILTGLGERYLVVFISFANTKKCRTKPSKICTSFIFIFTRNLFQ
jgi:hypothetical protein